MRYAALLALLLLAGCPNLDANSGSSGAAGSINAASCSPLDGVYRVSYRETFGTCGAQAEELIEYRSGVAVPTAASSCQAGGESMIGPCQLRRSSNCALSDGLSGALLGYAAVSGTLTETDGNKRLEGTLDVTVTKTTGNTCNSSYQTVFTRTAE